MQGASDSEGGFGQELDWPKLHKAHGSVHTGDIR